MNDKALFSISCGLYVVGVECGTALGGCVVDAFIQATAYPATVILCSQKHTRTNECIHETGRFSVSVLRDDVDPLTIAIFGFQSSRQVDKWSQVSHDLHEGLPVLREHAAWYLCRVVHTYEMGTHTLFHCAVEEAEAGEGTPLTYGVYRAQMRHATAAAFQEHKKRLAAAAQG